MSTQRSSFIETFLVQIDALEGWLRECLSGCGIDGAPGKRALTRLTELREEVVEVCDLIVAAQASFDLTKLTTYEQFDPKVLFSPELAKRSDAGIQDIGSNIQDELAGIARERKKALEAAAGADKTITAQTVLLWRQMSAADCVEEIGATVMRLAEAARYLFQTEFLRNLNSHQPAQA